MSYLHNVLVGFDQALNTLFGGHPDETISAHSGRAAKEGKLWGRALAAILNKIQANHVDLAAKGDEERALAVEQIEKKELEK